MTFVAASPDEIKQLLRDVVREELARLRPGAANDVEEILTVEQTAKLAHCSPRTVAAACKSGALEAKKPEGLSEWRITRAAAIQWLTKNDAKANPGAEVDRERKLAEAADRLLAPRRAAGGKQG